MNHIINHVRLLVTFIFLMIVAHGAARAAQPTLLDAESVQDKIRGGLLGHLVGDLRVWQRQYPGDWRATRWRVKEKYMRHGGELRDRNGFELNTASVIGALLYGQGDYVKTSIAAFNFGWDADNNAATAWTPTGEQFRTRAQAAGLKSPAMPVKIW